MPSYDQYMSVLCRTDEGAKVCAMNGLSTDVNIPYGGITKYSADGSLLAAARAETVAVVNAMTGESVCEIRCHRVSALAFSPNNTFLLCWSKPNKDEKNLNMFKLADGSEATPCFSVFQKGFSRDAWPSVQWSSDETTACRCVTNEVHFFDGTDFSKGIIDKLRLPGVDAAIMSPAGPCVACYIPEAKGAPASIALYDTSHLTDPTGKSTATAPLARKSFFKCSSARFMWNSTGTAVVVQTTSEVDTANKSYYGSSNLHFLTADGSYDGAVPLDKEGPIHDVQWNPNGLEFAVTYGFMPAKTTIFSSSCKVLQDFGSGAHNIVRFNAFGTYMAVCGFGNLPGDVDLYERKARNWGKINTVRVSNAVDLEWSPDGLAFLTMTVAPRLRVDNCYKVFNAAGYNVSCVNFPVLYAASWQPAPKGIYSGERLTKEELAKAKELAAAAPAAKKVEAFKPRHLRGVGSGNFSLSKDDEDLKGKAKAAFGAFRSKQTVVGAEFAQPSASAKKNAAKKAAKKKRQEEEAAAAAAAEAAKLKLSEQVATDPAKKLRNLKKKLKQIEDLEKKVADGLAPSAEQQAKLAGKDALLGEIKELE